jgi:hypothetical protein
MRGFHKDNPDFVTAPGKHFPDTYKKPNHPTFSDESKYHGGKYEGGHWGFENGKDTFTPGRTNLEQHTAKEIQDYFKEYEPNVILKLREAR